MGEKDLTNLLDLVPATAESTETSAPTHVTQPSETIERFESLDEISGISPELSSALPPLADAPLPELGAEFGGGMSLGLEPLPSEPMGELATPAEPLPPGPSLADQAMDQIKEFSEKLPVGKPVVQAALPFHLSIQGKLSPQEREKLLDLISRHQIGIREIDLEPQLEAGQCLLPRMSEYACVLVVQALRGISATIRMFPSDGPDADIGFVTQNAVAEKQMHGAEVDSSSFGHPAEDLPLTNLESLPGLRSHRVLGIVTASAILKSMAVEAETTSAYRELLDELARQLKYKAHYRGAKGIIGFETNLQRLADAQVYRLTVIGTAIAPLPRPT